MDGRFSAMMMLAGLLCAQGSAFAAPQPIATNKTRFRIPFKIEAAALQRLNARELQLHVSKDGGATWELSQALPPDGARFEYQAAEDGEYRFAVKTLDGRNQLHPPVGQYETGLIVVVDTLTPLLELSLQQLAPGRVQLSWNAADLHLDVSTLKIEYQQPGSQDWEQVEVTPKASGQIPWNVSQQGQVKVRGSIGDTATNVGRAQTQMQIIAVGDPVPKPKPGRRVPIAGLDDGQEQAAVGPQTQETRSPLNTGTRAGQPPVAAFDDRQLQASTGPVVAEAQNPTPVTSMPGAQLPGARVAQPTPSREESGEYRGPVITPFSGPASPPSMPLAHSPAIARPEITKDRWGDEPQTAVSQPAVSQPAPVSRNSGHHRVVNSRRFQVGYTVDDVGPSGIGSVELFITQDQGRKWWKYGDDPDRRSPFDVEVPQDGEYGFAIRVRSGVGLTNDPPLPSEPPSIVVAVDQTPPTVEFLSAQQGQGPHSNRVQVRWRISDDHLASKPVAVYYAPTRSGPWEAVSGWQDDQGGFEWSVTPATPAQFYVRIVARDSAGNTAKVESPQPVLVDLSRPTARIVDVEAPQTLGPK